MSTREQYEESGVALTSYLDELSSKTFYGMEPEMLNDLRTILAGLYQKFSYLAITAPTMCYKLDTVLQKIEHELYRAYYEEEN